MTDEERARFLRCVGDTEEQLAERGWDPRSLYVYSAGLEYCDAEIMDGGDR